MIDKEFKKSLFLVILLPVLSCFVSIGTSKKQLDINTQEIANLKEYHDKDIKEVNNRVDQSNIILQSINNNLAELNTKMSLLVEGKLKIKDE